jgi:hypothetical protein
VKEDDTGGTACVIHMEKMMNVYTILKKNLEGKRQFRSPNHIREDNIKWMLKE